MTFLLMAGNGPQVSEGGYAQTLKRSTDMENTNDIPNEEQTGRLQQPAVGGSHLDRFHFWTTSYYHHDNSYTMSDYLDYCLPEGFKVVEQDGSMAIVEGFDGLLWRLDASGNGDSYNHKVEASLL